MDRDGAEDALWKIYTRLGEIEKDLRFLRCEKDHYNDALCEKFWNK